MIHSFSDSIHSLAYLALFISMREDQSNARPTSCKLLRPKNADGERGITILFIQVTFGRANDDSLQLIYWPA